MKKNAFESLEKFKDIFQDFSQEEIQSISENSEYAKLKAGEFIFYEGTPSEKIYLIHKGQISLIKQNQKFSTSVSGEVVGIIGALTQSARSASASCDIQSEFFVLNLISLKERFPSIYTKLIINLSKMMPKRIFADIDFSTKKMTQEIASLNEKMKLGPLLIYILTLLAIFLIISPFTNLSPINSEFSLIINIPFIIISILVFLFMTRRGNSFKKFGIHSNNIRKVIFESFIFTFIIASVVTLIKFAILKKMHTFSFENLLHFNLINFKFLLGSLIFIPVQELIIRGYLQTIIQKFFENKYALFMSLLITNIFMVSFYNSNSPIILGTYFILGIFWGWLYNRNSSLVGVTISHIILNIYLIDILSINI